MSTYPKFNTPYEAGYDAGENGASMRNCHFGFFSTPERTKEWERGKAEAEAIHRRIKVGQLKKS